MGYLWFMMDQLILIGTNPWLDFSCSACPLNCVHNLPNASGICYLENTECFVWFSCILKSQSNEQLSSGQWGSNTLESFSSVNPFTKVVGFLQEWSCYIPLSPKVFDFLQKIGLYISLGADTNSIFTTEFLSHVYCFNHIFVLSSSMRVFKIFGGK